MLDFRVETFLCVCKNLSYTKTATELSITQPAVSGHIKFLEQYYGVKLFNYENKKLALTAEGEALRQALETISLDISHVKENLKNLNCQQTLNFGATKSIGDFVLSQKLPTFISSHPNLNVNVSVDDTTNLFNMLSSGKIDFFLCEGIINKTEYNYKFLANESMKALCSTDYNLGKIKSIKDLFGNRLILREPGSGSRDILEQKLLENGYSTSSFQEICTMNSPAMILKLVESGCGITFIFDSVCHEAIKNKKLRVIEIPGFSINHEYNVVWKKDSYFNETTSSYVDEICKLFDGSDQ